MWRDRLSEDEAARLRAWRTEWLELCADPAPADRPRVERAIAGLYEGLGRRPPIFRWVDSPRGAGSLLDDYPIASGAWPSRSSLRRELLTTIVEIHSLIVREIPRPLRAAFSDLLGVDDERSWEQRHWSHIATEVGVTVAGGAMSRYRDLRRSLWSFSITDRVRATVSELVAARDVLGLDLSPELAAGLEQWTEVIRTCGWWWPFPDACLVSERPIAIHWDAQERLHHAGEAAVRYRDGFQLFFWHDTPVPAAWITEPHRLDPRTALQWRNSEQRRAAVEILGWERVIDELGARTVDWDPDPAIGHLLEVLLPDGWIRLLRVRCGTGRQVVLLVPPNMWTARQANAWTYSLEPDDYSLEART